MAAKLVTKEGRSLPSFQETSIARRISISLNTGAELVGMATAASGGPQKYWDIAKPLIAELCNQWRRTGSCASCAPETLVGLGGWAGIDGGNQH
ncbi:uncharacterized protein BJX67DRAFT_386716 [Aspergillus lucknowensis]|uniref:Uncharacterized protein n=1 Tax=Aspergillus lucknowensis TaxID=176173 RepID=A0ABR4L3N2_9EURO